MSRWSQIYLFFSGIEYLELICTYVIQFSVCACICNHTCGVLMCVCSCVHLPFTDEETFADWYICVYIHTDIRCVSLFLTGSDCVSALGSCSDISVDKLGSKREGRKAFLQRRIGTPSETPRVRPSYSLSSIRRPHWTGEGWLLLTNGSQWNWVVSILRFSWIYWIGSVPVFGFPLVSIPFTRCVHMTQLWTQPRWSCTNLFIHHTCETGMLDKLTSKLT